MRFAEAREALFGAIVQDVTEHHALAAQLKQYESLDWGALYNADPGNALRLRDQRDQLQRQIAEKAATIQTRAQQHQQMQSEHAQKQWSLAVDAVKSRINVTPADDAAMLKQVQSLGFSESELKSRFADPRFLHLVYKAAKYDAQASGAKKPVPSAKAPPVLKQGVGGQPGVAAAQAYKAQRAALKKTGSVDDAARILAMRFKR